MIQETYCVSDRPRLAEIRRASRHWPPLDLTKRDVPFGELGTDGAWLWETLGAVLLQRGYLRSIDDMLFALLCRLYQQRCSGRFADDQELEPEFVKLLAGFGVTAQLLQQLEATRIA